MSRTCLFNFHATGGYFLLKYRLDIAERFPLRLITQLKAAFVDVSSLNYKEKCENYIFSK